MSAVSPDFRRLVGMDDAARESIMRRGTTPDRDALDGTEHLGANTAAWTRRLRMQQFIKGFERRPDGQLMGYNRRVAQDGVDGDWNSPSEPFAFFAIRDVDPSARDNRYLQALLLDYSAGGNRLLDPSRPIRDYLVRVEAGSDDLLLGRAFLALGPLRPSPTYFVLERRR